MKKAVVLKNIVKIMPIKINIEMFLRIKFMYFPESTYDFI